MGISFTTVVKKIQDDGNFKKMTFQASRSHRPLELVFSETNSSIIESEDWQEGDQVVVKIDRITKWRETCNLRAFLIIAAIPNITAMTLDSIMVSGYSLVDRIFIDRLT